jgi:hypothetical protein
MSAIHLMSLIIIKLYIGLEHEDIGAKTKIQINVQLINKRLPLPLLYIYLYALLIYLTITHFVPFKYFFSQKEYLFFPR